MFEWMAWTLPVAVFFCCIALMLVVMTVWVFYASMIVFLGAELTYLRSKQKRA